MCNLVQVYADVCALLTLRDIMVLVCTLECVHALTALGDRASEAVARVPGLLHTLVSLVTVEVSVLLVLLRTLVVAALS